ncbi:hypothetical protein BD309DRAFT_1012023 [Dichomitus squalens]|nr:hypothetical protein BD309DRAFT_1012023 [Dichomitus squalens]
MAAVASIAENATLVKYGSSCYDFPTTQSANGHLISSHMSESLRLSLATVTVYEDEALRDEYTAGASVNVNFGLRMYAAPFDLNRHERVTGERIAQTLVVFHVHIAEVETTTAVSSWRQQSLTLLSIDRDGLQPVSVVTAFTTPLSAILVSRFLLHLQSASLRAVGSIPSSQFSSLHLDRSLVFERVIGSLGASITAEDYLKEDYSDGDNVERADESTQASRE